MTLLELIQKEHETRFEYNACQLRQEEAKKNNVTISEWFKLEDELRERKHLWKHYQSSLCDELKQLVEMSK